MGIVTFIYQRFGVQLSLENRLTKIESQINKYDSACKKLDELSERLTTIEVRNELMWAPIEKTLVDVLHHPTKPERDVLLEKFRDSSITVDELHKLKELLHDPEEKGTVEEKAAILLEARLNQIIYDRTHDIYPFFKNIAIRGKC